MSILIGITSFFIRIHTWLFFNLNFYQKYCLKRMMKKIENSPENKDQDQNKIFKFNRKKRKGLPKNRILRKIILWVNKPRGELKEVEN